MLDIQSDSPYSSPVEKDIKIKGTLDIRGQQGYDFYKKNRKKYSGFIRRKRDYNTVLENLCYATQQLMLKKEGGVYMKHFGYLAVCMYPVKRRFSLPHLRMKKMYTFFPYFFGEESFKQWMIDRTFCQPILPQIYKNIKFHGFRYTLNYTILKNLRKALISARKNR